MQWYALAIIVFLADQAAKSYIDARTPSGWSHEVTSFFNLVHVLNPGAAFSFLAGAGGWQRWFFAAVAAGVSVAVVLWMRRVPRGEWWVSAALALVLGGAIGNLGDRLVLGHVVDFIDVFYGRWHWPAFNLADSAITVGVAVLLVDALRGQGQGRRT